MELKYGDQQSQPLRFKHIWSDARKTRLTSVCLSCSAIIAAGLDELSLIRAEQQHVCEPHQGNESGDL